MSEEDDLTDNISDSVGGNRSGMKGVKWTKHEDNLLKTLVDQYGEKWDLIASEIKDRSDIQCQQRWTKVVNPELIKGPWTKEVRKKLLIFQKSYDFLYIKKINLKNLSTKFMFSSFK